MKEGYQGIFVLLGPLTEGCLIMEAEWVENEYCFFQ
jgi:hypothetical protein